MKNRFSSPWHPRDVVLFLLRCRRLSLLHPQNPRNQPYPPPTFSGVLDARKRFCRKRKESRSPPDWTRADLTSDGRSYMLAMTTMAYMAAPPDHEHQGVSRDGRSEQTAEMRPCRCFPVCHTLATRARSLDAVEGTRILQQGKNMIGKNITSPRPASSFCPTSCGRAQAGAHVENLSAAHATGARPDCLPLPSQPNESN